jgi:ribonuclease J
MYQWVGPKTVIPVHGERMQIEAQAEFAKSCQIPHTIVPNNGSVIQLNLEEPKIIDFIETGLLAVDQTRIIKSDHQSIIARRKLQYSGTIHVSLVLDKKGNLMGDPQLDTVGLIDENNENELQFEDDIYNEILDVLDDIPKKDRLDDHIVSEEIRICLRRFVFQILKIKPKTSVHVIRI